jgi:hypothetical protein
MMRKTILRYMPGIGIGLIAGYAYWYFIGCSSGSCAITSSPVNSSIYGALLGLLLIGDTGKKGK